MVEALNHALRSADAPSLLDRLRSPAQPKAAQAKAAQAKAAQPKSSPEVLQQQAIETRNRDLHALCHHIHAARLSLGLELKQIHAETFIGLHHLQALDQGKIDRLPEDVYLRGFLRRLEKCLHRPEGDFISRLPKTIETQRTISQPLSVNSKPQTSLNLSFQPNYAYLTYAAFMASGVFLISHQGSPKSTLTPIKIDAQPPAPATIGKPQKMSSESMQKAQKRLSQNVSSPEVFV